MLWQVDHVEICLVNIDQNVRSSSPNGGEHHHNLKPSAQNWWTYKLPLKKYTWLVVSTQLKNISHHGNLPQIVVRIKNIWNHHLDTVDIELNIIFVGIGLQQMQLWLEGPWLIHSFVHPSSIRRPGRPGHGEGLVQPLGNGGRSEGPTGWSLFPLFDGRGSLKLLSIPIQI